MRKNLIILSLHLLSFCVASAQTWQPAGDRLKTRWAKDVTPETAWRSYPRPQLVRDEWININGLWDYAIVNKGDVQPASYQGKILVPYCIESSLSGVQKPLLPSNELWYRKQFKVPVTWAGKSVRLHFGAVDYKATVIVNGKQVGEHTGGSDAFNFDITRYLRSGNNELLVKVWDPTDSDIQPRGKQALKPVGFWYTPVSGIWQTVWMEPVNTTYLKDVNPETDIDNGQVTIRSVLVNARGTETASITVYYKGKVVKTLNVPYQQKISFKFTNAELWSPEHPELYHFDIQIAAGNHVIDKARSYFAMRKISMLKDEFGNLRMALNNKLLFQWGTLDQGWWPESLLTPPTEKAMLYDIQVLKEMGFNMLRKHIKVEPARYYFQADSIGLLLWQDMPSGMQYFNDPKQHVAFDAPVDFDRPKDSAVQFEKEWKSIMDNLRFFPSIVVWVPFNEGWGQYDTKRIVQWTEQYDRTRLVDGTSGWTDRKVGNMFDAHQYPGPSMEPGEQNPGRTMVLGEFGGLGWPVKDHIWDAKKRNWGYRTYTTEEQFQEEYARVIKNVYPLINRGLSAAIYTQTTDVEGEINGLMTYDREIIKMPVSMVLELSKPLYNKPVTSPVFLVKDSELSPESLHVAFEQPGTGWNLHNPFDEKFKMYTGPVKLSKNQKIWAVNSFVTKSNLKNMALKLYAQGDLKIYLNGNVIYDRAILTKRHYDEVNITEFMNHLKEGKNVIGLELTNPADSSSFDFGVYQY